MLYFKSKKLGKNLWFSEEKKQNKIYIIHKNNLVFFMKLFNDI